jgi:hypothetical protein
MNASEHNEEEVTITAKNLNMKALQLMLPLVIITFVPYYLIWRDYFSIDSIRAFIQSTKSWNGYGTIVILMVLLAGIVVHELIHGFTWAIFSKNGFRSIRFGIIWKELTPYCHCTQPMPVLHYRIGTFMPALVLGLLPTFVSYVTGNFWCAVFGAVFTAAAAGDFMILNILKNENGNDLVRDHPEKVGYYIYRKRN